MRENQRELKRIREIERELERQKEKNISRDLNDILKNCDNATISTRS